MEKEKKVFCKICNCDTILNSISFSRAHLSKCHNITTKEYFDKYIKNEKEGCCKVCDKETYFISYNQGYRKYCSYYCAGIDSETIKKTKNTEIWS